MPDDPHPIIRILGYVPIDKQNIRNPKNLLIYSDYMNLKIVNHEIKIELLIKIFDFDMKIFNISLLMNKNNFENDIPSTQILPKYQSNELITLNREFEGNTSNLIEEKKALQFKENIKEENNNSKDPAIFNSAKISNNNDTKLTNKLFPTYQNQNFFHEIHHISNPKEFEVKEHIENYVNYHEKYSEFKRYNKDIINFLFKFILHKNISAQIVSKLFENCYKDLKIHISGSKKRSDKKKKPFSDFSNYFKELEFDKFLEIKFLDYHCIIQYSSKQNIYPIILKRSWILLDKYIKNPDFFDKVYRFLEEKYNEYIIMQSIFKISIQVVKPIGFNIILTQNQKFLITEFMMEYGGNPIIEIIKDNDSNLPRDENLQNFIIRICLFLKNLEDLGIIYGDLKPSNILVSKINASTLFLKFIDFDIAYFYNSALKGNYLNNPRGFSQGYCSPELLNHFQSPTKANQIFNPLKSDIYSLGIIILELMNFFDGSEFNFSSIDLNKQDSETYKIFMNSIDTFAKTKALKEEKSIIEVAEICLNYDPLKRLSAKDLLMILKHLNQKSIKDIEQEYESLLKLRGV